jgi:surfeit locus 1 family protein
MAFYCKDYRFSFNWYFFIGTLFLCVFFIRLGFWQLDRAATKAHLHNSFVARFHLPPMFLSALPEEGDIHYYPVKLKGHYDNLHTILLDNKIYAHRVGYEVVTPFISDKNAQIVLVNRGWIPAGTDRAVLPIIPAATDTYIVGNIYISPGKPFTLEHTLEAKEVWPLRMQALDIPQIQNRLKKPLYPYLVLLSSTDTQQGFVRDWKPISTAAEKHTAYAVQWFSFAAILVILFFVLQIRKHEK